MVLLLHAQQAENQAKIATESGAPAWGGGKSYWGMNLDT